ncbi:hypothetical protein BT93_C0921 [Corymbia citriodora subsp. variegata]|nr:hypothetical protein BT93_C0921 [Corymbia citriodora subsp. variegata]
MQFNHELKSSSARLRFCCLRDPAAYHAAASSDEDSGGSGGSRAAQWRCSSLCPTAREPPLPKIRRTFRSLIARIGRCRRRGGVAAAEFGYDPMSYALNFEGDRSRELDGEFPTRDFSARLPVSPDRLLPAKMPREVVVCS